MTVLPQLWLARTDGDAARALERLLDPAEREGLRAITHSEARRRRAAAWGLRRWALSQAHPAIDAGTWRFKTGPFGKPELAPPFAALNLHHSLSYRGSLVTVLVATAPCGVDVEGPPAGLEAAAVVFSEDERAAVAAQGNPRERFLQQWVAKEAVLKLVGTGLGDRPERLSLDLTADGREARLRTTPIALPPRLEIRLWPLPDGAWLAAAFDGPAPALQPRFAPIS